MENFKYIQKYRNSMMNSHVPITQLQRLSAHAQFCFISIPTHSLEYFEANPSHHIFSFNISECNFRDEYASLLRQCHLSHLKS